MLALKGGYAIGDLSVQFTRAWVRPPGSNFFAGLTEANLGPPDLEVALRQHAAYRAALLGCRLEVVDLPVEEALPDSTFIEDTALIFPEGWVLCRPGALSRQGEVETVEKALSASGSPTLGRIIAPGILDGGDVCVAEQTVLVGLSARTNEAGVEQLDAILAPLGYHTTAIPLAGLPGVLHLKSGMTYVGDGRFVVDTRLLARLPIAPKRCLTVDAADAYASNCVRIGDAILVPSGFPRVRDDIARFTNLRVVELDMSEFRKMDGGLSCLSLRG